MAITLGDVAVMLRADSTGLRDDLDGAKKQTTSWATSLAGGLSTMLGGAVLAGVGAATAAVAGIGAAAFNASSDFDQATKRIQSQLGATDEQAVALRNTIEGVYANNFGESIEDVGDSVAAVQLAYERLGGASQQVIGQATEDALALRDAYGADVSKTMQAAVELQQKFGLTSQQAFDFLARGYQKGLDASGDFLGTITEYSTQFSEADATAAQFFSLMETGLSAGVLGTDKAADAFKEFRVRIGDGSTATAAGLEMLGINAEAFTAKLANGTMSGVEAFDIVLQKLREVEDPTLRMQAGVALLGTQYEDLGDSVVSGLSLATTASSDFVGAIDAVQKQYDTLPAFFEGLRRRAIVAISPLGDAMLEAFNSALPSIEAAFTRLETAIGSFIENSSFTWEPEFKQIKLGDLFEFVSEDGEVSVNIGDWFTFEKRDDYNRYRAGDFLEWVESQDQTAINIADFFVFEWSGEDLTKLKILDFVEFATDGEESTLNLAKFLSFEWDATGVTKLGIGDFIDFANEDGTVSISVGEWFSFSTEGDNGYRLKAGDFIDLESVTGVAGLLTDAANDIMIAMDAPDWLVEWGNMTWPEIKESTKTTLDGLIAWAWPDEPETIGELLGWDWPDAPKTISDLITWAWPEFSASLTNIVTTVTSFKWPELKKPAWIDQLLNFNIPTPAWVTALLNWSPRLPTLPGWLGGGDEDTTGSGATSGEGTPVPSNGNRGRSAVTASAAAAVRGPIIGVVNVYSDVDVEALAYRVAERLRYA